MEGRNPWEPPGLGECRQGWGGAQQEGKGGVPVSAEVGRREVGEGMESRPPRKRPLSRLGFEEQQVGTLPGRPPALRGEDSFHTEAVGVARAGGGDRPFPVWAALWASQPR